VARADWREHPPRWLEEILANPDFLSEATTAARRDACSPRLAVILQSARPLLPELLASERPLDLLEVRFGSPTSAATAFTTISTLFFVPWAHGDCSEKVAELQRISEALRRTSAEFLTCESMSISTGIGNGQRSTPLTTFYEAVALDSWRRARNSHAGATVSLQEKKLDIALQEYTKALTAWMRSVLGW
jgi:hypothetical protein